MLQSAIFADLQVNNFGIPTVRPVPSVPLASWMKDSFSQLFGWFRGDVRGVNIRALSHHLRRDIGLVD